MGQYCNRLYKDNIKQDLDKQLQNIINRTLIKIITTPHKTNEIKAPVLGEIAQLYLQLIVIITHITQPKTHIATPAQPPPPININTNTLSYKNQDHLKRTKQIIRQACIQVKSYRNKNLNSLLYNTTSIILLIR